jgi:hypothetical protein
MTKGQTEFIVAVGVILIALGIAGYTTYKTHQAISKPIHVIVEIQPTPTPTNTPVIPTQTPTPTLPIIISVPIENCDVKKSIHIAMTKDQVVNVCGNPERIDDSSPAVKRVEKVFKHDEIWYYDKQSETVELTNDIVTAIHPTILQALPMSHQ